MFYEYFFMDLFIYFFIKVNIKPRLYAMVSILDSLRQIEQCRGNKRGEDKGRLKEWGSGGKKKVLLLGRQPCWEISNQILLKRSVIKSNFNPSSQTAHKSIQLSQTNDKSTLSPTCFPLQRVIIAG